MPFRVTELCNRLLEASRDPAEVICQIRVSPLGDVIGQAVKGFGDGAGNAGTRVGISAETDGRPHCTFPVPELECRGESRRHRACSRYIKTAAAAEPPFRTQVVVELAGKPLANRPRRNRLPERKDRESDGLSSRNRIRMTMADRSLYCSQIQHFGLCRCQPAHSCHAHRAPFPQLP
jgi:hypothetical protein